MEAINTKIAFIRFSCLCAFIIIIGRLIYLQIYMNDHYLLKAERNFFRTHIIDPCRGNILDYQGNIIVTNRCLNSLYWYGTQNNLWNEDEIFQIKLLEKILDKTILNEDKISTLKQAQRNATGVLLADNITFEQLSKITECFPHDKHLQIHQRLVRSYPYKSLASHVIGYMQGLGNDYCGKMGLEKIFESRLKGSCGLGRSIINSKGASIEKIELQKALSGKDIITTIDLSLQQLAEEAFDKHQTGCLIIMDAKTGALRTILSRPNFDPNLFLNPISQEKWNRLQEKKVFLNRALNACYPPASLFKLIVMSAALENNLVQPNTMFTCKGFVHLKEREYYCNNKFGHGNLSIMQAIAQSCNIPFFELAKNKKIDIDLLATYAQKFGLGQKTAITLPENFGFVPSRKWKWETLHEHWWLGETLSAAIGQIYLATPLQIACMFNSIFSGYLIKPRILEHEPIEKRLLAISPGTLKVLRKCMKMGVADGTAQAIKTIKKLKIYAKTGTAQVVSSAKKENVEKKHREHAWLAAHVQYQNDDPLDIVLLLEHVGTSKEAIKIAKKLLIGYRNRMDAQKNIST